MKIAIVGAGIIGVTQAHELTADGHEVTVFERRSAAAEETSFANAGVIAPGYVTPWAAPGMPVKVLRHLLSRHAPVRLSLPLGSDVGGWIWRWWKACNTGSYLANRKRLQRLAIYSRTRLHQITADLQLEYDRSAGLIMLLRQEKDHQLAQAGLQILKELELPYKEITPEQTRQLEPALNPDTSFFAGIHLPDDEVGNCRQFALLLKSESQRLGARYEFNRSVERISAAAGTRPSLHLAGENEPRGFDAVVVCAGTDSAGLLRPLGLKIPLIPVYGYSISAHIREPLNAPRSALMDERYKVAISRLGQRVRVAGSAEIGGSLARKRASSIQTLYKVLHDWFPGAAQLSSGVQEWKGARPMLPDGPPVLGASGVPGVWLNLGHGSSGWALSCGSARCVADLISGRPPGFDTEGLDVSRLLR